MSAGQGVAMAPLARVERAGVELPVPLPPGAFRADGAPGDAHLWAS